MKKSSRIRSAAPGFTLVELMVALAIGSFLVIGATSVYMQGRAAFRVNEAVSRLHEDARYVLEVIESELRMAGYFGLQSRPQLVANAAGIADATPTGLDFAEQCNENWAIDLTNSIEVANDDYPWLTATCGPFGGTEQAGSDALTIRHVSEDPVAPVTGEMYIQASRFVDNQIFVGATVPDYATTGLDATNSQTHELAVSGYYVSTASSLGANIPSLRRWRLTPEDSSTEVTEEEILPGVEDIQVEFGIDTDDELDPNHGSINRYVHADDGVFDSTDPAFDPDARIIAVRIWVLVRALQAENGFTDTNVGNVYAYSDRDWGGVPNGQDNIRRVVVSRTVLLRNSRRRI